LGSDRLSRRTLLAGSGGLLLAGVGNAAAQEGIFMRPEEAPRALFPDASAVTDTTVTATAELRERVRALMRRAPSYWEPAYRVFRVARHAADPGFVIVVEEIGKHRPITFAVAVDGGARVVDVAVLAYREAYGGEVRDKRFLRQYSGKTLDDPLLPYRDIRNISGATLSVEATGRAARKAIAVLRALGDLR